MTLARSQPTDRAQRPRTKTNLLACLQPPLLLSHSRRVRTTTTARITWPPASKDLEKHGGDQERREALAGIAQTEYDMRDDTFLFGHVMDSSAEVPQQRGCRRSVCGLAKSCVQNLSLVARSW